MGRSACASAKVVLTSADETATIAQTKVNDAQTAITDAEAEAARLQRECHCRVNSQQTEGWAAAQGATSTHEVEWKKVDEVTSEPPREPTSLSSVFPGEWRDGKCLALQGKQSVIQSLVLSTELTKEEATASCKSACDALDNCVYANLQLLWPQSGPSNQKCEIGEKSIPGSPG